MSQVLENALLLLDLLHSNFRCGRMLYSRTYDMAGRFDMSCRRFMPADIS